MRLSELLNKFSNTDFLLTVDGWCDEMPFWEYENEKRQPYWKKYRNRKVASMAILTTNGMPELCVRLAIDIEKLEEMKGDK